MTNLCNLEASDPLWCANVSNRVEGQQTLMAQKSYMEKIFSFFIRMNISGPQRPSSCQSIDLI